MYHDVLLPVDLNEDHSWAKPLPVALKLCETFGARLHVVTVMPDLGTPMVGQYFPEGFEQRMRAGLVERLHAFTDAHVPAGITLQRIVAEGRIWEEILKAAETTGCDLIVMGSHQPALRDFLIGSNAWRVVHHARCSVLIVRE